MQELLQCLKTVRPNSTLIPLYTLAIEKGATISLDTMWRVTYNGNFYSCNNTDEIWNILNHRQPHPLPC